jgi:hypothetical protein
MRKFTAIAAAVVLLVSFALGASASARDIPVTLNLIGKTTKGHPVGQHRFFVTGVLLKAGDRTHRKGHFKAVFNRHSRIRGVFDLHNGKIKFDGFGNRVPIIGGTRHWAGATGTVKGKSLSENTVRFTAHVQ